LNDLISKEFPETDEDCELVDNYLASEMSRLSVEERERRLFELHGLLVVDPDPPSVEESFLALPEWVLTALKSSYDAGYMVKPSGSML
jgi:hypothetical protein